MRSRNSFIIIVVRKTLSGCRQIKEEKDREARYQEILADVDRIKEEYDIKTWSDIEAEKLENFEPKKGLPFIGGLKNSSTAKKNKSAYMQNWRNKIRSVN